MPPFLDIALAPDDNYAKYAKVVMQSAIDRCKIPLRFWILDGGLSENSKAMLKNTCGNVEFVKINEDMFRGFPANGYITVSTWYRFAIAELLPDSVKRVLYLDCDIAIADDISELADINLDNYAVAAVKDCIYKKFDKRIGLGLDYHYFNAGVLLINLNYWRQKNVCKRLFDFLAKSPNNLRLFDQSVLNLVLKDEYLELDLRYNVQYVPPFLEESCYEIGEFCKAFSKPKIIHFVNRFKPWNVDFGWLNPLNGYFTKYLKCEYTKSRTAIFLRLFAKRFARKPVILFRHYFWHNVVLCFTVKHLRQRK